MKSIKKCLCLSITLAATLLTFIQASAAPKKNKPESKTQQKITKKTVAKKPATKPLSKEKESKANQITGTGGLTEEELENLSGPLERSTQPVTSQKTPVLSNQKNMPQIRRPQSIQPVEPIANQITGTGGLTEEELENLSGPL